MDAMKYMRWSDALKYTKKSLDECVRDAKKVNTSYQNYLSANPYKNKKKELEERRKKLTSRILELIEQGGDRYDGK